MKRRQVSGSYDDLILAMPGLVGYWKLGERSGTVARDSFGSRHGTYVGTPTLGARPLVADGESSMLITGTQWMTVADAAAWSPSTTGALTVVNWILPADAGIYYYAGKASASYEWTLGSINLAIRAILHQAGGATHGSLTTAETISLTVPSCVAVTLEPDTRIEVFINGKSSAALTTGWAGSVSDTTDALFFGHRGDGAVPFQGWLQRPAIFNRRLSGGEIADIFAVGRG